jgi:hypothetical protein
MSLYLNGSQSPALSRGMAILEEVMNRFGSSALAARVATTVTPGIANPFFRIDESARKLVRYYKGDPQRAVDLTDAPVKTLQKTGSKPLNLVYHNLVKQRAAALKQTGDVDQAKREVSQLCRDLEKRGVHETVLDSIKTWEDTLTDGTSRKPRKPRSTSTRKRPTARRRKS